MYKVIVSHPDVEPFVNSKEVHESALALFKCECSNAVLYISNKPGRSASVELVKPDGTIDKKITITAHTV